MTVRVLNPKKRGRKARGYSPILPKTLDQMMIEKLEKLGMMRHENRTIAAILQCTEQEIIDRRTEDRLFEQALLRGKSRMIDTCATVVLSAAQGSKIGNPPALPTDQQVKAAMFYLEKHAPNWLKE